MKNRGNDEPAGPPKNSASDAKLRSHLGMVVLKIEAARPGLAGCRILNGTGKNSGPLFCSDRN